MIFLTIVKLALRSLAANKLRSILAMLGIIIGVAAVIAMMEIGQGSSRLVQDTIAKLGADNVLIFPGTLSNAGVSQGIGTVVTLHPQDCDAILRECTAVRAAAPIVSARVQLIYGSKNWSPSTMSSWTAGRHLTAPTKPACPERGRGPVSWRPGRRPAWS